MSELHFNAGHSDELRKLGVLDAEQTRVQASELVSASVEQGVLDEVMSLVSQELGQFSQRLLLAEMYLEGIETWLEPFQTEKLPEIIEQLQEVHRIYDEIVEQTPLMEQCFDALRTERVAKMPDTPVGEELQLYIDKVPRDADQVRAMAATIPERVDRIVDRLRGLVGDSPSE